MPRSRSVRYSPGVANLTMNLEGTYRCFLVVWNFAAVATRMIKTSAGFSKLSTDLVSP